MSFQLFDTLFQGFGFDFCFLFGFLFLHGDEGFESGCLGGVLWVRDGVLES